MTQAHSRRSVVLAAGGTGGHVFPALAIYQCLIAAGDDALLLTDERGLKYTGDFDASHVQVIPGGGLVSGSLRKRIGNLIKLLKGYKQSRRILKQRQPDLVIGLGGYGSVGPLLAAQHLGVPNVLHEQNVVMGAANKLTARKARVVALSFADTEGARGNCQVTGNPSRPAIVAIGDTPFPTPSVTDTLGVLIVGGSQGARSISETVPGALAALEHPVRTRLSVVHQARAEDHEKVAAAYAQADIVAEVVPFVDIPAALPKTHLVISRSGASTVSDVAVARRPAIYLPLLTHSDLQQVKNAQAVADHGGAHLHREDERQAGELAATVSALLNDPVALTDMANAARDWSRPDAAQAVLALLD